MAGAVLAGCVTPRRVGSVGAFLFYGGCPMCYCGCQFERYPRGPNEGCVCKLPRGYDCPMDMSEEELDRLNEEYEPDEDDD